MQYETKYSQGEKIVFLPRLLCENIFYAKEVVLRAYVYSSDFINRRDNWSTYTLKMWIKNRMEMLEIAIFYNTEK